MAAIFLVSSLPGVSCANPLAGQRLPDNAPPDAQTSKKEQRRRKKARQAQNRGDANAPAHVVPPPVDFGIGQYNGSSRFTNKERLVCLFHFSILLIINFVSMNFDVYLSLHCHTFVLLEHYVFGVQGYTIFDRFITLLIRYFNHES